MILGNEVTASQNRYWRIYIKYELRYSQKKQANPEPVIAVTNISVPAAALSVIGQNKDTLRFNYNGITYVKFKCKKLIETLPTSGDLLISIVGRGNINKWAGRETPQIMIDDIEIKQLEGF